MSYKELVNYRGETEYHVILSTYPNGTAAKLIRDLQKVPPWAVISVMTEDNDNRRHYFWRLEFVERKGDKGGT